MKATRKDHKLPDICLSLEKMRLDENEVIVLRPPAFGMTIDALNEIHRAVKSNASLADRVVMIHPAIAATVEARPTTPHEIHNASAGDIVKRIVRPTLEAGGQMTDVLVLLESIVVGVALVAIKLGGDEIVLDQVLAGARQRLAEQRLGTITPAGQG